MVGLGFMNGRRRTKSSARLNLFFAFALLSAPATFIATPRPTRPHVLPLPHFDLEQAERTEQEQRLRAARVSDGRLPNSIRAIGEQVRRLGHEIYASHTIDRGALNRLRSDAAQLLGSGEAERLLDLRALQAELFLRAIHQSLAEGEPTPDLVELGGEFSNLLFAAWVDDEGRCRLTDDALRLMFRAHFDQLTALREVPSFAPSLNELRRYYALLLEFPPSLDVTLAAKYQLGYAQALARVDPAFDENALLGILRLRLNQPGHAVKAFEDYLKAHPNGPFSHIVRGHLQFALAEARATTVDGY